MRIGGVVVAVPAVIYATGCGDDDGGGGGGIDASTGQTSFSVTNSDGSGHTHMFTMQCSDLSGGSAVNYTATGGGHTHSVPVSAADLTTIMGGGTATITFTDGHAHTFSITKPTNACT
jgi:hypothetical protein